MLEVLSPATTAEAAIAALQSAASAIYIRFGTERNAGFLEDDFLKTLRYCRVRNCKVYVEIDSWLADKELNGYLNLAIKAVRNGANAIIVQDLGLGALIHETMPQIPLHAGDRLAVQNLLDVENLAKLGYTRVHLANEMSFSELEFIARKASIETTVSVYSGGCVARRGQCFMSALSPNSKKSAGRGDCNLDCQQKYSMASRVEDEYPLKIGKICLAAHMDKLYDMGVTSVRIGEGVGPVYLMAGLTETLATCAKEKRRATAEEMAALELTFGSLRSADAMFMNKPLKAYEIHEPENKLGIRQKYKLRKNYEKNELRRVNVKFRVKAERGRALKVELIDEDGNLVTHTGVKLQKLRMVELKEADIYEPLYKTAGTTYNCVDVDVSLDMGIEAFRREYLDGIRIRLLDELTKERAKVDKLEVRKPMELPQTLRTNDKQKLVFQLSKVEQMTEELAELLPDYVYVPMKICLENYEDLRKFKLRGAKIVAIMPKVLKNDEISAYMADLENLRALGIAEVLISSLGQTNIMRKFGFRIRCDAGMGFYNSKAIAQAFRYGFESITCEPELKLTQIANLRKPIPMELIVYGRVPVMVTDYDIIARSGRRYVENGAVALSDRTGLVRPIFRDYGGRNIVYSAQKLYLCDKQSEILASGAFMQRIIFTSESANECIQTAKGCLGMINYVPNGVGRGAY